jgi:hypothetical protein
MKSPDSESFFARFFQKFFQRKIDHEIHERIFDHLNALRGDAYEFHTPKEHGYDFGTDEDLEARTEAYQMPELLRSLEEQIENMPGAYARAFRYILHRDISRRLRMFEEVGRRRLNRSCDPRPIIHRAY